MQGNVMNANNIINNICFICLHTLPHPSTLGITKFCGLSTLCADRGFKSVGQTFIDFLHQWFSHLFILVSVSPLPLAYLKQAAATVKVLYILYANL